MKTPVRQIEKLRSFNETPCFALSPRDEFASSWFHRRLLRTSPIDAAVQRQFAIASVISLIPAGIYRIKILDQE